VRLDDGALAVVIAVHAPDPFKPRVKVIVTAGGDRLDTPLEVNLFETQEERPGPKSVAACLDPAEYSIDPLLYL
jgi:hypothetical protein